MNYLEYIQETVCFIQSGEVESIVENMEFYFSFIQFLCSLISIVQEEEGKFNIHLRLEFDKNIKVARK